MEEVRQLYADPATSPFVRYGGGYAVFPPNDVRDSVTATIDLLAGGASRDGAWRKLVKHAWIGGQSAIHPASTWHAVTLGFVAFYEQHFKDSPRILQAALEAARILVKDEIELAWDKLQAFLLDQIDDISGWSSSWVRNDAEREGIVRRDDGTYWYRDPDAGGTLIQIIGDRLESADKFVGLVV